MFTLPNIVSQLPTREEYCTIYHSKRAELVRRWIEETVQSIIRQAEYSPNLFNIDIPYEIDEHHPLMSAFFAKLQELGYKTRTRTVKNQVIQYTYKC